jgi:hypothetical protein
MGDREPVSEKNLDGYDAPMIPWASAPSAGSPPWHVYEVTPTTVFDLGTDEPYGATRWRFE